jgi:hypothetical protein
MSMPLIIKSPTELTQDIRIRGATWENSTVSMLAYEEASRVTHSARFYSSPVTMDKDMITRVEEARGDSEPGVGKNWQAWFRNVPPDAGLRVEDEYSIRVIKGDALWQCRKGDDRAMTETLQGNPPSCGAADWLIEAPRVIGALILTDISEVSFLGRSALSVLGSLRTDLGFVAGSRVMSDRIVLSALTPGGDAYSFCIDGDLGILLRLEVRLYGRAFMVYEVKELELGMGLFNELFRTPLD